MQHQTPEEEAKREEEPLKEISEKKAKLLRDLKARDLIMRRGRRIYSHKTSAKPTFSASWY